MRVSERGKLLRIGHNNITLLLSLLVGVLTNEFIVDAYTYIHIVYVYTRKTFMAREISEGVQYCRYMQTNLH